MFPITFIIVNHDARKQVQIILLRYAATASVVEPKRYNGKIHCMSGPGEVKVSSADPQMVTETENTSK